MTSDTWRTEAFERFPELRARFEDLETPYMAWIQLATMFRTAYRAPRNDDLIQRIYAYSEWCAMQPEGLTAEDDLGTCVCACFFEHIPDSTEALEDMPRWFSRSDVLAMKEIFSHHAGEAGFQRILEAYDGHQWPQKKARKR